MHPPFLLLDEMTCRLANLCPPMGWVSWCLNLQRLVVWLGLPRSKSWAGYQRRGGWGASSFTVCYVRGTGFCGAKCCPEEAFASYPQTVSHLLSWAGSLTTFSLGLSNCGIQALGTGKTLDTAGEWEMRVWERVSGKSVFVYHSRSWMNRWVGNECARKTWWLASSGRWEAIPAWLEKSSRKKNPFSDALYFGVSFTSVIMTWNNISMPICIWKLVLSNA